MNDIAQEILKINQIKGFTVPSSIADTEGVLAKLMLVTTEVAEAAEEVRSGEAEAFALELADVIIRVLHISAGMGIDMDKTISHKLRINRERPFMHNKKA